MKKSKHHLYGTWYGMRERCYNPKNGWFHNYGARGIDVCKRWMSGENGKTGFEFGGCWFDPSGERQFMRG